MYRKTILPKAVIPASAQLVKRAMSNPRKEATVPKLKYRKALFKISGEALQGEQAFGIDPAVTARIAADLAEAVNTGAQIALVIGGGNIFRGVSLAAEGADRVTSDHMGMLATVMNSMAMKMAIESLSLEAAILSAVDIPKFCESFSQRALEAHLAAGRVVIFAAGTGNPYFTTDSAAALRACEMRADILVKGTQVDGIYSADPKKDPSAERFGTITYDEILKRDLKVMDTAAISLTRSAGIPIAVFSLAETGGFTRILQGEGRCTTVTA